MANTKLERPLEGSPPARRRLERQPAHEVDRGAEAGRHRGTHALASHARIMDAADGSEFLIVQALHADGDARGAGDNGGRKSFVRE